MERRIVTPRSDWQQQVEHVGFIYHTPGGAPYWDEKAYYTFSSAEIETLESATSDLYQMFLKAGDKIINENLFARFGIPEHIVPLIKRAWENEPPALNYGRFDFGFDGTGSPKLFEFNCDTPTSLLEAAVVQWQWKEQVFPNHDQFNSLHDKLLAKWQDIAPLISKDVHFLHAVDMVGEDAMNASYMRDLANEAGLNTIPVLVDDVGFNHDTGRFLDGDDRLIDTCVRLYPWEWLVNEDYGRGPLLQAENNTVWIEPIWKMMWSNKAILPILWKQNEGHPLLLPAGYEKPIANNYVKKPILGREGANVTIVKNDAVVAQTEGEYGEEGFVYQGLFESKTFDHMTPVIGSWIVDGEPAGIGIREDVGVTANGSMFIPHIIEG